MNNFLILLMIILLCGFAMLKGTSLKPYAPVVKKVPLQEVPYIGRIQILNGCGSSGAAHTMADYLRKNNFDVKNIGNADNWNYQETIVISRSIDTSIAHQVATVLINARTVLIRTPETGYDATVIVGNDYRERLR